METWWGLSCLVFLCFLLHVQGQREFDLADALDDPEPTKKPTSDIYPKPPYHPQPGHPDSGGNIYPKPKPPYHPQPGHPDSGGNIYPKPKPPLYPQPGDSGHHGGGYLNDVDRDDGRYPPRPRPRPPAGGGGGGGGGGYPSYDSSGSTYGRGGVSRPNPPYRKTYGGDDHSTYGNPQGNTVAKIVSPIVSVVVVTLVGAAATYLNKRRNCFRNSEPVNV
ncbi:glycoprotein Xg [Nycticebus coucang]|uniref:glycoprotein Xg n=1 Tax=Nycticebus coucang TaxID=9470 RepID=UPI00234E117E|nr:glycoprotein Xg [Nycticebus coucang]